MAYQRLQKRLREARKVEDTMTLASRIWLAGIGALVRAQQEGPEFFDQLVQCGEILEAVEEDDGLRELKRLARCRYADAVRGPRNRGLTPPARETTAPLPQRERSFRTGS